MKKNYLLTIFVLCFTAISFSQAKTYYWRNPDAINGNWEVTVNWWNSTDGLAQIPAGGEILRMDNNHETTMTNDLAATNRHRIFFDATATTSRTIGGVTENTFFDFGGNNPKIENSSTALHTLNFPMKIGYNPMEINPVNGDLTLGGNLDFQGNFLDIYGDNTKILTFNGTLSGTGGISIQQNSKVVLNTASTFTGQVTVNRGDLEVNADMAGGIEVNNDGNLLVDADLTIPYLTLNNTATVTIKAGKSITISGNLTNNSSNAILVEAGASLIVTGTATGNITYNVAVSDTNWHLISAPVVGEQYNDAWVTTNSIPTSTLDTGNKAIATYDNTSVDTDSDGAGTSDSATGHWRYFEGGTNVTFGPGVGYSIKRTSGTNYAFTGTYPDGTKTPAISTNVSDWNLIGNPYPSNIDIATFITENTTTNDFIADGFDAIYVWNGTAYTELTSGSIQPGQAFFIKSKVDGTANITEAMQTTVTGTFYKSSNPSISLNLSNGTSTKKTKINYLDGKTASLDPGFDIGMFDGVASGIRIYTHLIENNEGIAFARQALPNSDLESLVVPVGVKAAANTEITISAEALNVPAGIKVFLEDKVTNTFTRLDETNSKYKITLTDAVNGVGRFYLYTTQSSLSIKDVALNGVSIFKSDASTIRIAGLPQGKTTVSLFNLLGKKVMTTSFEAKGVKDISLPKLATGIYFAKMQTETGKISKKIILE
ncbi:MAG: T9SS type A sorting domain-containing protein [Polaribacter sp.]|uniref:T9SS type A sorting domain-containing protein n=1 Tax=Polaribacter sp. TaxID=1920175 RepID=UPI002F359FAC